MSETTAIRIGTAGWSIPRAAAARFDQPGTHLQRYARRFRCTEINSSFHRPHAATTYAKWRDSTPPDFRFAVKIPKLITHERKLRDVREPLVEFLRQTDALAVKRGPLLMQLPPSLAFDEPVVKAFLDEVRQVYAGPLVCEPRHATWFEPAVTQLLGRYRIARVATDPAPVPAAASPAGWPGIAYFRLHGSPRTYWSRYDAKAMAGLASTIADMTAGPARQRTGNGESGTERSTAGSALRARPTTGTPDTRSGLDVWCIFDNTASGAAIENAWELQERLAPAQERSDPAPADAQR